MNRQEKKKTLISSDITSVQSNTTHLRETTAGIMRMRGDRSKKGGVSTRDTRVVRACTRTALHLLDQGLLG